MSHAIFLMILLSFKEKQTLFDIYVDPNNLMSKQLLPIIDFKITIFIKN